jgi:fructosamine-3-kinase
MTNQPMFHSNAHGDIWQEPTLFDQGGPPNITLPAHTFGLERDDLLTDVWPDDED